MTQNDHQEQSPRDVFSELHAMMKLFDLRMMQLQGGRIRVWRVIPEDGVERLEAYDAHGVMDAEQFAASMFPRELELDFRLTVERRAAWLQWKGFFELDESRLDLPDG